MITRSHLFRAHVAIRLLVTLVFVSPAVAQGPSKDYAQKYHEPFKGPPRKADDFAPIGGDPDHCVKYEADALSITMPAGKSRPPTGVATTFGVSGDFAITVSYAILQEPEPPDAGVPNTGTRISLAVKLDKGREAAIRRKITPKAPVHILTWEVLRDDPKAEPIRHGVMFPVKEKSGRLRFVRTGAELAYYLSEGIDKDFALLTTVPFTADDVQEVQVFGHTSSPKAALDVRFTNLHIDADAFVNRPARPPRVPVPPMEKAEIPLPMAEYAQAYYHSFKGNPAPAAGWGFHGAGNPESVRFEREGLRITLAAGNPGSGVQSKFSVSGDFEITLSYELLKGPQPDALAKAGVPDTRLTLAVVKDTPTKDSPNCDVATHSRIINSKGRHGLVNWMRLGDPDAKRNNTVHVKFYPTAPTTKMGRLRLVRSGQDLYYLHAPGIDEPFTVQSKAAFGTEDLCRVEIVGATPHETAALDARVSDIRIRAHALPNAPTTHAVPARASVPGPPTAPAATEGSALITVLWIGLAAIAVMAAAVSIRFLSARRRRAGQVPTAPQPAENAPCAVTVRCDCGKNLRVKDTLAGKRIKCPQCGNVILVPTANR